MHAQARPVLAAFRSVAPLVGAWTALARRWRGPWLLRLCLILLPALAAAVSGPVRAQAPQAVPALTQRVTDLTGTLNPDQRNALEAKLAAFEQAKGSQIVVLMVPTTQPEDIVAYANRVGNAWKVGRREVGDGVLLLVAKNDRKVRIEVAKTLEGAIPDLAARQVIDEAITPRFRQGDFAGGLDAAVDQLIARITGEALPAPAPVWTGAHEDPAADASSWVDLGIFVLVAFPIVTGILRRLLGRPLGALATGGGIGAVAWLLTSSVVLGVVAGVITLFLALVIGGVPAAVAAAARNAGRGGSWGGGSWGGGSGSDSSGGGGFSSGGGGDFGGGGASGDW